MGFICLALFDLTCDSEKAFWRVEMTGGEEEEKFSNANTPCISATLMRIALKFVGFDGLTSFLMPSTESEPGHLPGCTQHQAPD